MNKLLFCIPLLFINLTACSLTQETQDSNASSVAPVKSSKHRRHKSQDGVISLDIYREKGRLHLLTGKQRLNQKTLWYQYSIDDGISWSPAVKILNEDNLAVRMKRGNDAQITAQADNIIVTWTKFDPNKRFNAGAMQAVRSTDNGQHWQYTNSPPDWKKGPHGYIDLSADQQAIHAVWLDKRDKGTGKKATQGLRYAHSTDGGLNWHRNKTLDKVSCSCCWNTIKSDTDGNTYVLYRDKNPSDMSIGVIKQQQWQYQNHVGAFNWQFDGCPHIGGSIDFQHTGAKKRIHAVVGTGHPDHLGVHYLYSDDYGKSWSTPISLGNESAIHADIAAHNDGRVIAVWDMMTENGFIIYKSESTDQGITWSTPKQLSKSNRRATHPRITKTKTGFLSLWTEKQGDQQRLVMKRL